MFADAAAKCLAVSRASLLSARNDSALGLEARVALGADVGTVQSRLSWSLLQTLLRRFDGADKRYAKAVAEALMRTGRCNGETGGNDSNEWKNKEVTFVPQFLFDVFKDGQDGGESFSERPDAVFLLRILVDNGYLVQGAEMGACYCRVLIIFVFFEFVFFFVFSLTVGSITFSILCLLFLILDISNFPI